MSKLEYPVGTPGRVVVGFAELAEKVLIFSRGLDDRVIEIMKYYLLTGAAGGAGQEAEREVTFLYRGEEGDKHLFHILGMKEGEVGVARLARAIYDKIASDVENRVKEEPFRDFCAPPWVSLRRVGRRRGVRKSVLHAPGARRVGRCRAARLRLGRSGGRRAERRQFRPRGGRAGPPVRRQAQPSVQRG